MRLSRMGVLLGSTSAIAYSSISANHDGQPADSSQMAADIEEVTAEVVGNVQRVCAAWHIIAAEQLEAVESVHADGYLLFAAAPLLCSVMEHAARIGWVLGGSTATARAARSWLADVVSNGEDKITHLNPATRRRAWPAPRRGSRSSASAPCPTCSVVNDQFVTETKPRDPEAEADSR